MGLDLGALLSGITQGMGSAQDFKLAEQMRAAAEQQRSSERNQDFSRRLSLSTASSGVTEGLSDPRLIALAEQIQGKNKTSEDQALMQQAIRLQEALGPEAAAQLLSSGVPVTPGSFLSAARTRGESDAATTDALVSTLPATVRPVVRSLFDSGKDKDRSAALSIIAAHSAPTTTKDPKDPSRTVVEVDTDGDGVKEKVVFDLSQVEPGTVLGTVPRTPTSPKSPDPLDRKFMEKNIRTRLRAIAVKARGEETVKNAEHRAALQGKDPIQHLMDLGLITPEDVRKIYDSETGSQKQSAGEPTSMEDAFNQFNKNLSALVQERERRNKQ